MTDSIAWSLIGWLFASVRSVSRLATRPATAWRPHSELRWAAANSAKSTRTFLLTVITLTTVIGLAVVVLLPVCVAVRLTVAASSAASKGAAASVLIVLPAGLRQRERSWRRIVAVRALRGK